MFFLVTGSAGSGKSAALRELSGRVPELVAIDTDDWRAPADAPSTWWDERIEVCVRDAVLRRFEGRHTLMAGWTPLAEVLAAPSSPSLHGVVACLLDCDDRVRARRIEERAASGTWRIHAPEEVNHYLRAAEEMRTNAGDALLRIDTSTLSVSDVAGRLEDWISGILRNVERRIR